MRSGERAQWGGGGEWDKNCAEKSPSLMEQRPGERKRPVCLQGRHKPERAGEPVPLAAASVKK